MTYKEFLKRSQQVQRKYIRDEQKRNDKLLKLWYAYKAKAHKLGFHPLDRSEIIARSDELRGMLARVDETHGDTKAQRANYEMFEGRVAIP